MERSIESLRSQRKMLYFAQFLIEQNLDHLALTFPRDEIDNIIAGLQSVNDDMWDQLHQMEYPQLVTYKGAA